MAINMPKKEPDLFGKIAQGAGTLIGAGIGTMVAPGPGTVLGAALGGAAGGVAGGIANKDPGQAVGSAAQGMTGAMQRRLDAPKAPEATPAPTSPETNAIQDGLDSLPHLPVEQQELYGPELNNAYRIARRRDFGRLA